MIVEPVYSGNKYLLKDRPVQSKNGIHFGITLFYGIQWP